MKKILIVDDNENNRMLIHALLEEYASQKSQSFTIVEATNGQEACTLSKGDHFDLVFMDIMMPIMDGIEATRIIRIQDPKVMIIAVSASDDSKRQKEILTNGAEDYLSKPLDVTIFMARMDNYFALIDSRNGANKRFNPSPANLFTQETYSRKLLFYIRNDDELAEFWEYYLLDQGAGSEALSATVRTFYAIGSIGVKLELNIQIIVEDADDYLFMTMVGIGELKENLIKLMILKNSDNPEYKLTADKLCIRVPISKKVTEIQTIKVVEPIKAVAVEPVVIESPYVAPIIQTPQVEAALSVYDYMDEDDLDDLMVHVGKLNSLMMLVGSEIDAHEVEEIAYHLQQISRVTSGYTDSYRIGNAFSSMGNSIMTHVSTFIEKSRAISPLCTAFGRDLSTWIRLIFSEGASSVNFMDDTIIANAQMIEAVLTMDEQATSSEENLDDIFDF
jgi:two-component system chemotaxis response regulator CheY